VPKLIDTHYLFVTAVRVFGQKGYQATTTQEIARRAKTNEVTLFRRYGTKAKLLETALRHCLTDTPFAHVTGSDDVRADLLAITRAYVATHEAYGAAVITLIDEVSLFPELRGALTVLQRNLANAASIIAAHQAKGRLAPGDPLQTLVFLFAPLMAASLWARAGLKAPPLRPEAVVQAFLEGHGPGKKRPAPRRASNAVSK